MALVQGAKFKNKKGGLCLSKRFNNQFETMKMHVIYAPLTPAAQAALAHDVSPVQCLQALLCLFR